MEKKVKELILELQDTLTKVKILNGLLPICASCKKIRDDEGYWTQVEEYIEKNSQATFTHGICPECMKKLYPQYSSMSMDKYSIDMELTVDNG